MPAGSPIFPLLGERWVQNYGTGVENLHFHNFMEIGFCYYGDWILMLGENEKYMIEFANRMMERIHVFVKSMNLALIENKMFIK